MGLARRSWSQLKRGTAPKPSPRANGKPSSSSFTGLEGQSRGGGCNTLTSYKHQMTRRQWLLDRPCLMLGTKASFGSVWYRTLANERRRRLHTGYAGVGSPQCNGLISVLQWTELHYAPVHGKYNILPCSGN